MGQHGQRLNTGTCFSVSSDDKMVLFLFPGIPTGDPAIVAFYDKRIYIKGGGHWYALLLAFPFFCISFFFVYSFISSFFLIVTFLSWTRLHAT
jgi:hypothetical protein